ncbi:hypothetical protein GCM10022261_00400 [Brevibacterium daeguense]|uniref:Carboxylate-amine ligase n=1 Tax=Brevibacterium daeguense TaxID=909936 RepID=A0ABP8EEV6_9MICO|nr:hypothetical protein [Brevibacterium daeguense]
MLYFDARLSDHVPTLEVRVADVCQSDEQAAVIAGLLRALVETAVRDWQAGHLVMSVPAAVLRTWMWQASSSGVDADLIDPLTGTPAAAAVVVGRLLDTVRAVLDEYEETGRVEEILAEILSAGSGARPQREVHQTTSDVAAIVRRALEATHASSREGAALRSAVAARGLRAL